MEQYSEVYGGLPNIVTPHTPITLSDLEMCFVQYLPIRLKGEVWTLTLPDNLEICRDLVNTCVKDCKDFIPNISDKYVYLTVKKVYGTGNRSGWHCDGFGTDDINYIWYDKHPTEFLFSSEGLQLPQDHKRSIDVMGEVGSGNGKVIYPNKSILRLTQESIHRVSPKPFNDLRTFVKVTFSDDIYNLKGNARNYKLGHNATDWVMHERSEERNHPIRK